MPPILVVSDREAGQRRRRVEAGHLDGDGGGLLADVVAARLLLAAGQRLVEVLGRQHAEHDGPPGVQPDAHDPGRGLAGHVLEVRRLAADDAAEADHRVVIGGQRPGGERDLERPGHPRHRDVVVGDAGRRQSAAGTVEQAQRDVAVEAGGDDGHAQTGTVEHRLGDARPADVLGHQPVAPAGEMSSPTRSTICRPNPSRPP